MANRAESPRAILSEAIRIRAEAYRRWRSAADAEPAGLVRRFYEALARFECDRYDELVRRYARGDTRPESATATSFLPRLDLPPGGGRRAPLRRAAVAAEAERRTWAQRLRRTGFESPEGWMLASLVEDARRFRDQVR